MLDKKKLRKLSSKRILNMANVFRNIGEQPDAMQTRLGRPRLHISDELYEKVENEIIDQIDEIMLITGIPLEKLISKLISHRSHNEQLQIFDNMDAMAVEPIAYMVRNDDVQALYLPEDKYRPRSSQHDSKPRFLSFGKITQLQDGNVEWTERGRFKISELAQAQNQ